MMKKIFLFLIFLTSCKGKEVTGIYVANHKRGEDTLILNQDSTYIHLFMSKNGTKNINKGKWEKGEEEGWIDFENFNFYIQGLNSYQPDTTVKSYWPVKIEYDFRGNPYFTINDDLGWRFKRINSK